MWSILSKKIKTILFWGLIVACLSGGVSLLFPWQYSAETQLLIISRNSYGADPSTQVQSAERVGNSLTQIIGTSDFYKKVMENQEASFNKERWNNYTERQRRKHWQKDLTASMVYGTGLLRLVAYSGTQEDAVALSSSAAKVLALRAFEYVGGDLAVKIVSDPIASRFPARPNFILNVILGFAAGVILSVLAIAYKHRHHHFVFG